MTASGNFRRGAATMVAGSVLTQALAFASVLVFARLYTQDAIGLSFFCVSVAGLLSAVATLRLDLAIVLSPNRRESGRIAATVYLQTAVLAFVLLAVTAWIGGELASFAAPGISTTTWAWLITPLLIATVMVQVGLSEANRDGRFTLLVLIELMINLATILVGVLLSFAEVSDEGLVIARVIAQVLGAAGLLGAGYLMVARRVLLELRTVTKQVWTKYRQFLIFNTPYSIIGTFTRDLPIYIFSVGGGAALVAQYAMARTITMAPTTLFSTAISRVYYKEAVDHLGTPRLESLTNRLNMFSMFVSLAPFALLSVWGDVAFVLLLGDQWELAGVMAMLLAPSLWMSLQTAWTQRIFEVTRRQGVSFTVQISFDMVHALVLISVYHFTDSPVWTIAAYGLTYFVFVTAYLIAVYRVAGFSLARMLPKLALAWLGYFCCVVGFAAIRLATDSAVIGMALCAFIAAVPSLAIAARFAVRRSRGPAPARSV